MFLLACLSVETVLEVVGVVTLGVGAGKSLGDSIRGRE